MNPRQHELADATGGIHAVLLLTEGEVRLMAHDSERVMADIRIRATQIGSVLEGILHEPHGDSRRGLNQ